MEISEIAAKAPPKQQSPPSKRSRRIALVTALQAIWALLIVGLAIYLLLLARSKPQEHALGLRIAAGFILAPGLVAGAGWIGLRRSKRWGWWLSLICDCGIVAAFVYAIIDDATEGLLDWGLVSIGLIALIVPTMLLFPASGRFYVSRSGAQFV